MPTRRRGHLTDAETLRAYEAGESIVVLAVAEGLSAYGVISRLRRARQRRGLWAPPPRRQRIAVDTWAALEEAVGRLRDSVGVL